MKDTKTDKTENKHTSGKLSDASACSVWIRYELTRDGNTNLFHGGEIKSLKMDDSVLPQFFELEMVDGKVYRIQPEIYGDEKSVGLFLPNAEFTRATKDKD